MYLYECTLGAVVHQAEYPKRFGHVVGLDVKYDVPFVLVQFADNPDTKEVFEPRELISGTRAFHMMPTAERV